MAKKINEAHFQVHEEQAKAKAKAIEHEAQMVLKNSKISVAEAELAAKKVYEEKASKLAREYDKKFEHLSKKELNLKNEENNLKTQTQKNKTYAEELKRSYGELAVLQEDNENLKKEYEQKLEEVLVVLEKSAGMTKSEATDILLQKVEEENRANIAHIVRKYEEEAKEEAEAKANYIIAQATTRFAGEYAQERLINIVNIKNDDLKGRIIGREGRNIKTLEMVLGVDIIIDDTPNAIIVSHFNIYRRAIATRVIELLIEDGRIQPAKIEEMHKKVSAEFENKLVKDGEQIVMDLGIGKVHPEIVKLIGKLKYRASYGQNALGHSLEVAHLAGIIAAECGGNAKLAKRAGLLHDIGKALTHEMEGSHVELGGMICKRYNEHPVVINAIYAHHGHEEIRSVECAAVCAADALSAARPGARREVLEAFLKRVSELEEIATKHNGIKNAYAINAGREIRVIANAKLVNDDEAVLVAKEIAKEIEEKLQFPGEIKVNVIREIRSVEYARKQTDGDISKGA